MAEAATVTSDPGDRVEPIIQLLSQLASGDLSARGRRSGQDDEIDAVLLGINMLAEDLEANNSELEARVQDRTAELEHLNANIMQLTEMGNLLQACELADEAYKVLEHGLTAMFPGVSGAAYLFSASRNLLTLKAAWGDAQTVDAMTREEC